MTPQNDLIKDMERGFLSGLVFAANVPDRDEEVRKAFVELNGAVDLFSAAPNRELARAILDLHEEEGDVASVGDPMKIFPRVQKGTFDDVQHLSDYLMNFNGVATDLMASLTEIRRAAVRRKGHMILTACAARLVGSDNVEEVINESIRALVDLQETQVNRKRITAVPYSDAMMDGLEHVREMMEARLKGQALPGARLNIHSVDHLLGRGLKPGTLAILAARPGCGKTALAAQWAQESIRLAHDPGEGGPKPWAAFITMEMTVRELILRDFAAISDLDSQLLDTGQVTEDQFNALCNAVQGVLSDRRILVHEMVRSVDDAITAIQADTIRMGCFPTIVVIDYLQLFEESGRNRGNRSDALGEMTRGLKLTAKSQHTPILLLSQLNREIEHRTNKEPQLSDLRDSGAIEADADYAMFLWSESNFATEDAAIPTRNIQFSIPKNRHGGTGKTLLSFKKKATRFYAIERETAGSSASWSSVPPRAQVPKGTQRDLLGDV